MEPSPATPPDSPGGTPSAALPTRPDADRVEVPPAAPMASPPAADAATGAVPSPATPATPGPTRARPPVPARTTLPPGLRLPYYPTGLQWQRPPSSARAAAATSGGGEAAASPASAVGTGTTPAQGWGSAVASADRPPLLGQVTPVLPSRPAPPAVRSWLAPLGPAVAADNWPLFSDVFRCADPQDSNGAQAVWRAFREFAVAAGSDARPAAERDFGSFIRSVGSSAACMRFMLRCNPGRVLLVLHPVAELPFVAGCQEYAYLEDWHLRLCHRPAVPFGHSSALANVGCVGHLLALSPVGPPTAPAEQALEAARRSRSELVSTRRAGHGAIFLPVRSGIGLAPARAPLPPAIASRCATPRLQTYEYPPVIHQQQSLLQAYPCHPIQGTAYVMMTAAIVSGLLRAYRETHRVLEPSLCHYALTETFAVDDLAVAVGGFRGWKGRGPSAVDSTPAGAPPKYPDPGQQGNDLSESQGDRIWSGAGFFPCGFPNPPTTCSNCSLWGDSSVWCISGGQFGRWRSGW